MTFLRVIFDHLGGQKNGFLDFFEVISAYLRECLSIGLGLKGPHIDVLSVRKSEKLPKYLRLIVKYWPSAGFILTIFEVKKVDI